MAAWKAARARSTRSRPSILRRRFAPSEPGSLESSSSSVYGVTNDAASERLPRLAPPLAAVPVDVTVRDDSLPRRHGPWFRRGRLAGGNYSPGFKESGWPAGEGRTP